MEMDGTVIAAIINGVSKLANIVTSYFLKKHNEESFCFYQAFLKFIDENDFLY